YKNNGILGFVGSKREKKINNKYIKSINIKTHSGNEIVKNLSGGNQQKVVLGKWLANHSKIFIMDEPTNGIDVGAKEEIYSLINKLAGNSCGILCVSSYMPELMDICDRILVMSSGQIIANVKRKDFNEEKLLALAIQNI
ncbi:MAG TPA: ATP-binding cassette domain-containing protein, partial [Victivallales bacterium]|nr:ATP-binding cassette domain-containing protein [Victivallales bacterium]